MTGPLFRQTLALVWLRAKELTSTRPCVVMVALALWCALVGTGGWMVAQSDGAAVLGAVATGAFVLWVVAPLFGAGANEIATAQRLAPYPVSPDAVFWATWVACVFDVATLLLTPLLLGLAAGAGGPVGLAVAVLYFLAATGTGQLVGWSTVWVSRSNRPLLNAGALATAGSVAFWAAHGRVDPMAPARLLPDAVAASGTGSWGDVLRASAVLIVCGALAVFVARSVHRRLPSEAGAGRRQRSHRARGLPAGPTGALTVAMTRSTLRAPTARLLLVGAVLSPALSRVLLTGGAPMDARSLAVSATLAICATITVNSFAFDGGGAALAVLSPLTTGLVLAAKAASTLVPVTGAVFGAMVVGALSGVTTVPSPATVALTFGYIAVGVACGLNWSVRRAAAADHDSLRGRPALVRSSVGFLAALTVNAGMVEAAGVVAPVVALGVCVCLCLVWWWRALRAAPRRLEDLIVTVAR